MIRPEHAVAIATLALANLWQLYDRVKKRGRFEGQMMERVSKIEDFIKNHAERRRDPADLVRIARLMANHNPDDATSGLIQAVLHKYEPHKPSWNPDMPPVNIDQ